MKNFRFYLVCMLLGFSGAAVCQNPSRAYKDYLLQEQLFDSAVALMRAEQNKQAIKLFKRAGQNMNTSATSLAYSGFCYVGLSKNKKGLKKIKESFEHGFKLKYIDEDDSLLSPLMPKIKAMYPQARQKYVASLDTLLRAEIAAMIKADQQIRLLLSNPKYQKKAQIDSIYKEMGLIDDRNIKRLHEICLKHGWPSAKLVGTAVSFDDDANFKPSLLVLHSNEADNIYFLNLMLKKALKDEEYWTDVVSVMSNMLFRFYDQKIIKLRNTYITKDGRLDMDKSFFQLKCLSKLIKNNQRYKATFCVVKYEDDKETFNTKVLLQEVIDFLLADGVPKENITFTEEVKEVKPDNFERYRIAFSRSRL